MAAARRERDSDRDQSEAIEHLQEQLLEAMARARVQEARADEAEKSALEAEEQLEGMARGQLQQSEQLRSELVQAHEQVRLAQLRVEEAQARAHAAERLPAAPQNLLHLSPEIELPPRPVKQSRTNLVLSGLLASALSFGGAAYFMFYAPLQQQVVALEQQRTLDMQEHARALSTLQAQSDAERQGLEAKNAELKTHLEAARAEAAAANEATEGRRGSRSARARSADDDAADADDTSPTRSAKAIERRMRRSRASDAEDEPTPAASSKRRVNDDDNSDDPLGGL